MNWLLATVGGILIGLSATLLLLFNGRIAGISGILNGVLRPSRTKSWSTESWRWLFLGGMLAGGALYEYVLAPQPEPTDAFAPVAMVVGCFLVGFGTRLGNGCTSGHGVCGLGRLSARSLVAVLTFMAAAIATVYCTRHVFLLG